MYLVHIEKPYKSNKLKITAPTWNYEIKFPYSYYSVPILITILNISLKSTKYLQQFFLFMCPPSMELNKINHRLVFKIKDVYELELQRLETKKLFGSTKKKKKKCRQCVEP